MKNVIITDGFWRKSLSCVRSLGKAGYNVTVLGDSVLTTAFWSGFTNNRVLSPSSKENLSDFNSFVTKYIEKKNFELGDKIILIPSEDSTINWLSAHRRKISKHAQFLIPDQNSLKRAQSKESTLRAAYNIGIDIPETYFFKNYNQFKKKIHFLSRKNLLNKYIIKPDVGSGSIGIIYPKENNIKNLSFHWKKFGKLLIQKKINSKGNGIGVSMIFDKNSRCIANFSHKRIKEYPLKGGPSTIRKSIKNKNLQNLSKKLLQKLNWKGVAMVEWKIDIDEKKIKLLEINPRFWGSLELAVRSGVNFPLLYAHLCSGRKVKVNKRYKPGVICRWIFPGDILRFINDKNNKENFWNFIKSIFKEGEEYDSKDIRGFISSIFCNLFSVFKPKYWKYLTR